MCFQRLDLFLLKAELLVFETDLLVELSQRIALYRQLLVFQLQLLLEAAKLLAFGVQL